MKNRTLKIIATLAVALGGIVFVATQSAGDVEYYVHVEQVMEKPNEWLGKKNLQVHGFVVPGSIHEEVRDQTTRRTFQLESKGKVVDVRHAGVRPDTFKDQAEAVVRGALALENGALVLTAVNGEAGIMAKCPSKYNGQR